MNTLLKKFEKLIGRLSFAKKFLTLSLIFLLICFYLAGVIGYQAREQIAFTKQELRGVEYAGAIVTAMDELDKLRVAPQAERAAKSDALTQALADLGEQARRHDAEFGTAKFSAQIKADEPAGLPSALLVLLGEVADASNLTLDPDIDTFYLMDSVTQRLPAYAEAAVELLSATAATRPFLLHDMAANEALIASNFKKVDTKNPGAGAKLNGAFEAVQQTAKRLHDGDISNATVMAATGSAMALVKAQMQKLDELLAIRNQGFYLKLVNLASLTLVCLVFAGLFLLLIYRSMRQGLIAAIGATKAIAAGQLDHHFDIESQDEIGAVLSSVKAMQMNLIESRDTMKQMAEDERRMGAESASYLDAISKSQGMIEFGLDGRILTANDNFLKVVGYSLDEVKGQHHSMFVDPAYRASSEYRQFWEQLGRGQFDSGQYKRIAKGGGEVWIEASYNPIVDVDGKAVKVVKYASDITEKMKATLTLEQAVAQTQAVVTAAQDGDLTQRVSLDGKSGAIGDLCKGVNALVAAMAGVVGQIKSSTESIKTASREIASGNNDLSSRTEQQAASLEETASSMEELTSTVKQNAENARQANQLAIGASDVALKGGQVVGQVVTTMASINESSKKIVDIISVIDGIAFQTNILALNAAVEAARAGEQGRGFAVVAAEVRSLAQRSASAAKEIKGLIGDSVEKVGNGSKLVELAGKTMDEIVTSVKRVTDIMAEITAASQEQSAGIEQVNQAITQMDEVTQQNAALVEEASAAARSLEEQASNLAGAVAAFTVEVAPSSTVHRLEAGPAPEPRPELRAEPSPARGPRPAAKRPAPKPASRGASKANGHAHGSDSSEQWAEF